MQNAKFTVSDPVETHLKCFIHLRVICESIEQNMSYCDVMSEAGLGQLQYVWNNHAKIKHIYQRNFK